jgi:hypothetical protein
MYYRVWGQLPSNAELLKLSEHLTDNMALKVSLIYNIYQINYFEHLDILHKYLTYN